MPTPAGTQRPDNATMNGTPFHHSGVAAEQQLEDARLAYIFHGTPRA